MRIAPLKPDSEQCGECRRRANYRVRLRNVSNVMLCHRCAVRLVVGLVGRIASAEAQSPAPGSKRSDGRET